MKCEHDNCLTCPYPDCISEKGPVNKTKKKPGRKKIDPEVKRQNANRWQKDYYQQTKEERLKYCHKYYREHAEEIRQKQKEYRDKKRGYKGPLANIWITNGKENKRIKEKDFEQWQVKGWTRGRILNPYKENKDEK